MNHPINKDDLSLCSKREALLWIKDILEAYKRLFSLDMLEDLSYLDLCIDQKVSVFEARKKAFEIHKKARISKDINEKNLYRAIAHGIATYHVKEHAQRSFDYLKKIK